MGTSKRGWANSIGAGGEKARDGLREEVAFHWTREEADEDTGHRHEGGGQLCLTASTDAQMHGRARYVGGGARSVRLPCDHPRDG